MKRAITLNEVAGYVTEKSVWKLILDLSSAGGDLCQCSPEQIEVDANQFILVNTTGGKNTLNPFAPPEYSGEANESAEVWALGALAFYTLMGVAIFEGIGGKNQTDTMIIPRIGTSHCSPILSDTIYRCLSYNPSQRPAMAQLQKTAEERLETKDHPQKQLTMTSGKKYNSSLVKFWPEEMCRTIMLLLVLLTPFASTAQTKRDVPAEMNVLVQRCKDLRNIKNMSRVTWDFTYDSLWTLMDELSIDRQGECTTKQKVKTLDLNSLCYRIMKLNAGVTNTGGRFRNGMDNRYQYSFIELTAQKGSNVSYDITGRSGKQIFAIVPYYDNSAIEVSVSYNGKSNCKEEVSDHVTYLFIDDNLNYNDTLHLTIENCSKEHISFVIINFNSRKHQR